MFKEIPKPVGRWRLEYCNVKLNHKIDFFYSDFSPLNYFSPKK